jgi:predicted DNA-binding protein
MATNLRLKPDLERALRDEAERTGRSQQEIIRSALDAYLGRVTESDLSSDAVARRRARLIPAKRPYRAPRVRIDLPDGVTSLDLLDREDRL